MSAGPDHDFLRQFPIVEQPDSEMKRKFVLAFIDAHPADFVHLQQLIQNERDLIEIMRKFYEFLDHRGFDKRFSESSVFGALCEEARSAIKSK